MSQSRRKALDKKLWELCWTRCKGYCEKCGLPMNEEDCDLHHRKLRSRGGEDTPENALMVHHACHLQHRDSIHDNPAFSLLVGWMVSSWANPAEVSVTLPSGTTVMLTNEGTYLEKEGVSG